jgi:hypothetical protein
MRRAFAWYPDFASIHGREQIEGFVLRLLVPESGEDEVPITVYGGPEDEMYVRFLRAGQPSMTTKVSVGATVATPWEEREFTVLQRFDHAKLAWSAKPVVPVRETRIPAIRLKITPGETEDGVWLQKFRPREVLLGGKPFEVIYGRKRLPLGFSLTLDRFRMPMYPGTNRPRSFESHVTITDAATHDSRSRVISMNHPVEHAGYTLYQSSYNTSGKMTVSFLSVSRDPGQLVVFAGYILTMIGMVIVLGLRLQDRARMARHREAGGEP